MRSDLPGDVRADVTSGQGAASGATPAVAAISWLVVAAALLALAEFWRWIVIGLVVLLGLTIVGVLLEGRRARRHGNGADPEPSRPPGR